MMTFLHKFLIFTLFCLNTVVFSQTLGSRLDKKTLTLGEVGTFTINISNLQGKAVGIAPKNELLPFHFEEVKDSTSVTPDFYDRTITFSVFQEGKFTIPALNISIGGEQFNTIPYEIEVINTANKGDEINDIMNNKSSKLSFTDYWELYKWYFYAALIAVAIIFAVWFIIKYSRRKKSSPKVAVNLTLKELAALKKKKYIESDQYRSFYVELLEIVRNFISVQYHLPADVLLTDDLIDLMKKTNKISTSNEKIIEEIFLRGDMVKFAKTFPDQGTMNNDFENIKEVVKKSAQEIEIDNLRNGV